MGHRLSKIVTRTGDKGTTGLATGDRINKSSARINAIGEVDELNCHLGIVLTHELSDDIRAPLARIQNELFNLGGELAMPPAELIKEVDVERLEADVEALNADLPPLKEFVLPGGNPPAAAAHLARAVARRVERSLWALHAEEPLNEFAPRYANRLSDLLFVISRKLARANGGKEVSWSH
ncbi:cob(I)yrinic acid a,c-diamide adenosyltransferase [Stenotrophobium rhamnosiphilum]|uniref:Corrinoid adenosyltransferase n=1 Tax=Stenotrophobium rhamnosiphilum TaxID=2029166 RepID=A0A2T5MGB2_9GAMM|nr:cob(I)yrinic acid a,c-diamide adenosyltransferase [Stenotrophobium rhamnosiphilum]PTU31617.1 cob(I)yrinic acid a,c-diamide adenosyltransferase [Stenotrophobium rhamnosiphilum]